MADRPYLSIGEVLGLLLEEFPDVTISKIRFLESQGLIDPERTASGYRKFYDSDVDLLRVILREQRENFLPLRVIRDRLESGAIEDPTGPTTPPRGIRNVQSNGAATDVPSASDSGHPSQHQPASAERDGSEDVLEAAAAAGVPPAPDPQRTYLAAEVCRTAGLTATQLSELESFGLVTSKGAGDARRFTQADVAIAEAAGRFMQHGVEARHLRAWRQAAEREAALFEQMILPLLRQRNPRARQQAVETLSTLADLGGELRSAIVRSTLSHHLEA
jgi:DNA-binding transcriptional MerR regulator